MCCAEFIVKYVLFFVNLVFSLAGLALIGIGIAVTYHISDILNLIPVNVNAIPIFLIVAGCAVFLISFCGCWGAIRETSCLLVMYSVCMIILAAAKIYLAVVIFRNLGDLQETVEKWVDDAFASNQLGGPFQVLETAFQCCGTTGANSYFNQNLVVPPTCCAAPLNNTCSVEDSFGGCTQRLGSYFETYGEAIGVVLIIIIVVELCAMIFGLYLNHTITDKRRNTY